MLKSKKIIFSIFCLIFINIALFSKPIIIQKSTDISNIANYKNSYPENEDGEFQDMLTPEYYLSEIGSSFRFEINKFVYFARQSQFHNPLENEEGEIPQYIISRNFGDGIGQNSTSQHHPAIDFNIENHETDVDMFAVYDGYVTTYTDSPKYREYLTITKDIVDSTGNFIGKIVTLYAHIDLDLDSSEGINLNGQYVNKGDLVSANLYAGTTGGPHLHFEIRFYRPNDLGNEEFYSFVGPGGSSIFTEPSASIWTYGYWNPNIGYGFGNPNNHIQNILNIQENARLPSSYLLNNYPNPFNPTTTITFKLKSNSKVNLSIYNLKGQLVKNLANENLSQGIKSYIWNGKNQQGTSVTSGIYFYKLSVGNETQMKRMILLK